MEIYCLGTCSFYYTFMEKYEHTIAYLISRVLGPAPLVIILWFVVALRSGIGFWKAIWVYPLIFIFSIGIPLLLTTYLVMLKKVTDIDWSNIEDRNKYLMPISLISLFIFLILIFLLTNTTIFHLALVLALIILVSVYITAILKFKISGHMILASLTFAGINLFFDMKFLWVYILLLPIAWARYTLKVHTVKELLAGTILSNGIMLLALLIFGWPTVPK